MNCPNCFFGVVWLFLLIKFNQQDDISTLSKDNKSIKSPVDKLKINQGNALEKRKFSYDLAEEAKNQSPKNKESKKRIEEKLNITKEWYI